MWGYAEKLPALELFIAEARDKDKEQIRRGGSRQARPPPSPSPALSTTPTNHPPAYGTDLVVVSASIRPTPLQASAVLVFCNRITTVRV